MMIPPIFSSFLVENSHFWHISPVFMQMTAPYIATTRSPVGRRDVAAHRTAR